MVEGPRQRGPPRCRPASDHPHPPTPAARAAEPPCPTVMGPPASCARRGRWLPTPQAQIVLLLKRRICARALRRRGCGSASALLRQARSPLFVPPRPATEEHLARRPAGRAAHIVLICSVFLSVNTYNIMSSFIEPYARSCWSKTPPLPFAFAAGAVPVPVPRCSLLSVLCRLSLSCPCWMPRTLSLRSGVPIIH